VALDFDAEEVGNGLIFSTQRKYTEQRKVLATLWGNYFEFLGLVPKSHAGTSL